MIASQRKSIPFNEILPPPVIFKDINTTPNTETIAPMTNSPFSLLLYTRYNRNKRNHNRSKTCLTNIFYSVGFSNKVQKRLKHRQEKKIPKVSFSYLFHLKHYEHQNRCHQKSKSNYTYHRKVTYIQQVRSPNKTCTP